MSSFRDAISRTRQTLNPLATQIPPVQQSFQAPSSAAGGLSSPFGYHAATTPYTPASAVRQYNPQQWGLTTLNPEQAMHYPPRNEGDVEGEMVTSCVGRGSQADVCNVDI